MVQQNAWTALPYVLTDLGAQSLSQVTETTVFWNNYPIVVYFIEEYVTFTKLRWIFNYYFELWYW